ncbi:MAG: single-stranded-DNA-specific exonuclease RecJ [Bacteroidia bacterium]
MEYQWKPVKLPDEGEIESLKNSINVNKIIAALLCQRGIKDFETAKKFFRPTIDQLYDPFLFKDMKKAVERIEFAIDNKQKILVYGDYDVDGTTSVAIVFSFLNKFTKAIEYYIPDRYKEGYGVSKAGIDYAADNNFSLIICLDCGIRSDKLVAYSNSKGIDFIICDHHLPGETLPSAMAILDAKVPGETYPFKELSGCGVGFKLIQAFAIFKKLPAENYLQYLDLVAVSTCCDIVPIVDENRIIVKYGLEKLNQNPSLGLKVLKESCINKKELTTSDVVFYIGPRINAVGRLYDAKTAVKLLIVTEEDEAIDYTEILNSTNTERKGIDETITAQALELIQSDPFHPQRFTNVLFNPDWHKGVIGIVASRIIEHHYRPTIVLGFSDGKISGSARSIKGFDIHEALIECRDLLLQFGGHTHAAGLSMLPENLPLFIAMFDEVASRHLTRDMLQPVINYDLQIAPEEITPSLIKLLKQFEPYGPGNMTPLFYTKTLKDSGYARQMGQGNLHLSLNVQNPNFETPIKGVAFKHGDKYDSIKNNKPFEAIFSIQEEEFNGRTSVQFHIRDLRLN